MGSGAANRYAATPLCKMHLLTVMIDPPDSISVAEFMSTEKYGRFPIAKSRNPYTCGLSGKSRNAADVILREDYLARGIGKALQFHPQQTSEWDQVVAVFSLNSVCRLYRQKLTK